MSSYVDAAKQKSREKLADFVRRELVGKKPQDIRVVCFPGAEIEGQEALEVKEVYDKLGIPRQNITGLEYDHENAERLRRAGLGITVVETDASRFFRETGKSFDIISLDYTGQQTDQAIETLADISGRGVLRPRAILATNYSTKRLSKKMQRDLAVRELSGKVSDVLTARQSVDYGAEHMLEHDIEDDGWMHAEAENIAQGNIDLESARETISKIIKWSLWSGEFGRMYFTREIPQWLGGNALRQAIIEQTRSDLQKAHEAKDVFYAIQFGERDPMDLSEAEVFTVGHAPFRRAIRSVLTQGLLKTKLFSKKQAYYCAADILLRYDNGYAVTNHERYRYRSNKGEDMFFDLAAVKRPSEFFASIDKAFSLVSTNSGLYVQLNANVTRRKLERLLTEANECANALGKFYFAEPHPRIDLGSSYVAKPRIHVKDIIDLMESGTQLHEIAGVYAIPKRISREHGLALRELGVTPQQFYDHFGLEKMTVAGWAAHVSRLQKQSAN